MYLTKRSALVRNVTVATVNGAITLIILLIAPLGIVAVWINTILVAIASFAAATLADRVVVFLQHDPQRVQVMADRSESRSMQRPQDFRS